MKMKRSQLLHNITADYGTVEQIAEICSIYDREISLNLRLFLSLAQEAEVTDDPTQFRAGSDS